MVSPYFSGHAVAILDDLDTDQNTGTSRQIQNSFQAWEIRHYFILLVIANGEAKRTRKTVSVSAHLRMAAAK